MNQPHLIFATLILFTLGSCSKSDDNKPDNKECGEESTAGMTVTSAADWDWYPQKGGAASYENEYLVDIDDNKADFGIFVQFDNACPHSPTDIGMTFVSLVNAEDIEVSVIAAELGANNSDVELPVTRSGQVYSTYLPYVYAANNGANPTKLRAAAHVRFPTKGSWKSDSTYFFGAILQNYDLTLHAKVPK